MPIHLRRAVWLLGLCQCVLWGVLYYSFSVLLVPMERDLGLSRTAVAGAFSAGLSAMAVLAPVIGRSLDAGHAARVTRLGIALAMSGLSLVAAAHGPVALYLGWLGIGAAMAMLLYEPAFALVIRAVADDGHRLRALAAVTVLGGLASAIFLPLLATAIDRWGWRTAVLACAGVVLLAAGVLETRVIPALPAAGPVLRPPMQSHGRWPPHLTAVVAIFASGTLASMAMTTLMIPLLVDRGASPSMAALVLATMGLAQLPGRIWLLRGRRELPSGVIKVLPIVLQAAGLCVVIATHRPWLMAAGVAAFGLGAGLQTLARPWLVQKLYGVADAGRWNGEIARIQGFARAAGPVVMAGAAWLVGIPTVLTGLGVVLMLTAPIARRLPVTATPLT